MSDEIQHTILVVDDTDTNIDILLNTLGDDYEIMVALDGEKALGLLAEAPADLILLDIMMPGMDGYEVCRRLKADATTRDIPVIFISALSETVDETKGLELGAVDYITKPFTPAIVKARVQTHLALSDQKRQLEKQVKERTRELEESKALADEANRAKSAFLENMSHELRTPLNHIHGLTDLLLGMEEDSERLELLQYIHDGTSKLTILFKQLLNLSLLESDHVEISYGPMDLADVLSKIEKTFSEYAKNNECGFHLTVKDGVPARVRGARVETMQILHNILINAFHYTDKGEVSLEADIDPEHYPDLDNQAVMVRFVIRDTGVGIPEDKLESIFHSFEIGEEHMTKRLSGSGVGLTISKYLAVKLKGYIWVESELGKGSAFYVSLPFAVDS